MTNLREIAVANQDFPLAAFIRDIEDAGAKADYDVLRVMYDRMKAAEDHAELLDWAATEAVIKDTE